jgi:dsDNA-specific endonuclease/ATPase MutS2
MLKEFDKIRLKTGERGAILELFDDGAYLVEISATNGKIRVDEISKQDIVAKIVEVEEPLFA